MARSYGLFSEVAVNYALLAEGSPSEAGCRTEATIDYISEQYVRFKGAGLGKKALKAYWQECLGARVEEVKEITKKYEAILLSKKKAPKILKAKKKSSSEKIVNKKPASKKAIHIEVREVIAA